MTNESNTTMNEALAHALQSAGHKAVTINFEEDKINWVEPTLGHDDFMLGLQKFPSELSAFLKRVNPMDLPALTEVFKMHLDPSDVVTIDRINTDFRYRFDDGKMIIIDLKGELKQEDGKFTFIGLLSERDIVADEAHGQNKSLFIRSESARSLLVKEVEQALQANADTQSQDTKGFMLITGIDRFSIYNQAYGTQFVDALLNDLEKNFCALLAPYKAKITRLCGDQYMFFFPLQDSYEMDHIARNILDKINNMGIQTLNGNIRMNFSMGGVSLKEKAKHAGDYIVMAEAALNASKYAGRGRFTSYNEEMFASPLDSRKLLKSADSFLQAYEEGRFKLAFQPVIKSDGGDISFYECLLRIVDEKDRLIPAGLFMTKIEDFGLVHLADQFALHQAIEELNNYPDLVLSVNVSNASLNNPIWLRSVVSLLTGKQQIASRLIIEITETTVMRNMQQSKAVITTLKDLGCRIALDDFGSGYTSFHQMKEIKPDILKIDGYFSTELHLEENQVFIDAIQMLADGFNLETVAEGAETMSDADKLRNRGVHNVQGYAYGHPSVKRLWLPKTYADIEIA